MQVLPSDCGNRCMMECHGHLTMKWFAMTWACYDMSLRQHEPAPTRACDDIACDDGGQVFNDWSHAIHSDRNSIA
jgi:hypothetical protein